MAALQMAIVHIIGLSSTTVT